MNIGVGQTGGTCWFNSSLNIFLTSDNGLKILWQKLQEVYPRLGPKQKSYFNSNIGVPCPYGKLNKTPRVYFWKFLNQYICAIGGPGSLIPKSGLNAYLLKNIKWKNEATRESKGVAGGWPHNELKTILNHLGFRRGSEYRVVEISHHRYKFSDAWTNPILLVHGEKIKNYYSGIPLPAKNPSFNNNKNTGLFLTKGKYELTGAIVYVEPAENSGRRPHVWSCSIRNGRGYVIDSNYPTSPKECDWWLNDRLKNFLSTVNVPYRPDRAKKMVFDILLYTRKEFTNKITPTCQRTYRPLTANNEQKLKQFQQWGSANFLMSGRIGNAHKMYSPRVRAEAIRQNSKRPLMTASTFNKFVNEAGSFNHGMRLLQHAKNAQGLVYKVNKNGQNYKNYRKKLIAKFPNPVPNSVFLMFWRNSKTNTEFARRIRNYADTAGYTVNENKLKSVMNRRATTRAGVKRVRNAETERMYLVNDRDWFNSNGTNVSNKINENNWVRTTNNNKSQLVRSYANATNVKTFKRKVANFNSARAARTRRL